MAARRGASLALGMGVSEIDASLLSPADADFLIVDLNWLVLRAGDEAVTRIKAFLVAAKPVAFVQAGINVTQEELTSFTSRTAFWPVVMTVMTSSINGPVGPGTSGPDPSRVIVFARLVQLRGDATSTDDLQRTAARCEGTSYDWAHADLAVRDILGRVLRDSGVLG